MSDAFSDALGERQYASQYGTPAVGLVVYRGGVPAASDGNVAAARMETLDGTIIFDRQALSTATGTYEVVLSSAETQTPGIYKVVWSYTIDGIPQNFTALLEVGESSPAYDHLDEGMKGVVESVWLRFADLFDSPEGGPHLQVYFQTRFGRGRMAQLLRQALGRLNTIAQPHMTYSLEGPPDGKQFPLAQWGGLLEQALYIEAIKHLIRSYVEQPEAVGVNVARLDRRDYMTRWQTILTMEQADLQSQLDVFKMAHMGLGRPRVLVSGGVFGTYGPTRLSHSAAARPRYWARFH
jgi:hypothetical protein